MQNNAKDNYREPLDRAREAIAATYDLVKTKDRPLALSPIETGFKNGLGLSAQASTFSVCFGCETCTTVCPVVANYENPQETLGLLPHQIMHSCGLGIRDLALGSNMLWDCATCYECQESCPQGVCVTDVLYELKNEAVKHLAKHRFKPARGG
jgi:heterodisulfide reductase subunit C